MSSGDSFSSFVIEARPYEDADVMRLVAEVQAEYVIMYGGPDEAVIAPDEFSRPNGLLLVGLLAGEVVAMGGWRRMPVDIDGDGSDGLARAELKRMYVTPAARRRGLSRRMLAEIERDAAASGIRELLLNTGPVQRAAIALYLDSGYTPAPPFGHYAATGGALFYGKKLAADHRR